MIFSTFYFSATGNTKWVVEQFCRIVRNSGNKAEMYTIDAYEKLTDDVIKAILNDSDYIGFAIPIYGADMPVIMKRFISRLNVLQRNENLLSKTVYMINTFGYVNAFGPIAAKKIFINTRFNLTTHVNIRMCNDISTPELKSGQISRVTFDQRKARAGKKLIILTKRLLSGLKYIDGIGPYLIPGIIIRKKLRAAIADHYKALSVNMHSCSGCMLCVRNCPTQSIYFNDGRFEFTSGCTGCMRCYNFCPTFSIVTGGVYADPNIYHRYRGPDTL